METVQRPRDTLPDSIAGLISLPTGTTPEHIATEVQPDEAPPNVFSKWLRSESVILASIPVVGYWFAYSYERGYCGYLGIPQELITLSFTSILATSAFLSSMLYVILAGVYIIKTRGGHPNRIVERAIRFVGAMAIATILFAFITPTLELSRQFRTLLFAGVIAFLWVFAYPVFDAWRKKITYTESMSRFDARPILPKELSGYAVALLGRVGANIVGSILMVYVICLGVGLANASSQTVFPVLSNSDTAILRIYGDHGICGKINRQTHTVGPDFSIVKIDEHLTFTLEHIGPLTPARPR